MATVAPSRKPGFWAAVEGRKPAPAPAPAAPKKAAPDMGNPISPQNTPETPAAKKARKQPAAKAAKRGRRAAGGKQLEK